LPSWNLPRMTSKGWEKKKKMRVQATKGGERRQREKENPTARKFKMFLK